MNESSILIFEHPELGFKIYKENNFFFSVIENKSDDICKYVLIFTKGFEEGFNCQNYTKQCEKPCELCAARHKSNHIKVKR